MCPARCWAASGAASPSPATPTRARARPRRRSRERRRAAAPRPAAARSRRQTTPIPPTRAARGSAQVHLHGGRIAVEQEVHDLPRHLGRFGDLEAVPLRELRGGRRRVRGAARAPGRRSAPGGAAGRGPPARRRSGRRGGEPVLILELLWWVGWAWFAAWIALPLVAVPLLGVVPGFVVWAVLAPWSALLGMATLHRMLPNSEPGTFRLP